MVSIIAMLQADKKDLAQRLETATLSLKSLETKVEKGDKARKSTENAAMSQKLAEAIEARNALALDVQVSCGAAFAHPSFPPSGMGCLFLLFLSFLLSSSFSSSLLLSVYSWNPHLTHCAYACHSILTTLTTNRRHCAPSSRAR